MVGVVLELDTQTLQSQYISCGIIKLYQRVEMNHFTGFEIEMAFMKFMLASAHV